MLDLSWPFFDPAHRDLGARLDQWVARNLVNGHGPDVDAECRTLVAMLGREGFLRLCVADEDNQPPDVRSLAIARSKLARADGLADFAFAMQGLGSGAISLFGTPQQRSRWLPGVASGDCIAAFALTEPDTGSDAANIRCTARRDGDQWVLDGEKTYISNGPIADFFTLFARTGSVEDGAKGISAFIVPAGTPGLSVAGRIEVIAPHPLARLRLENVRLPAHKLLGQEGQGFRIAMETLNLFRVTVGAAALGFGARALDEALSFTRQRPLGAGTLADNAVTQDRLGTMATSLDASALLIARAAWAQDCIGGDQRRAAAMAKLHATEEAQKVIDAALQMHGGLGVTTGAKIEQLYREIRALRIYEGASEVQRLVIARTLLK